MRAVDLARAVTGKWAAHVEAALFARQVGVDVADDAVRTGRDRGVAALDWHRRRELVECNRAARAGPVHEGIVRGPIQRESRHLVLGGVIANSRQHPH